MAKQTDNVYEQATQLIKNAKYAIAFTGAGISVESGIPPFRGEGGLWNDYDPNILSLSTFYANPTSSWTAIREIFYQHWGEAFPNEAHKALALLEEKNLLKAIVTMNIDNLHQKAGSKNVIEFHGTLDKMICTKCERRYNSRAISLKTIPPTCEHCNGILKPDFVFFEEGIPTQAYSQSQNLAEKADLVIIIGTTGEVAPASYIPIIAKRRGAKVIEINPSESTYSSSITDCKISEKAGIALPKILSLL